MMIPVFSVLLGALVSAQQTPPPLDCTQLANGVQRWGCKSFESCNNGAVEFVECSGSEAYDQNTQRCVPYDQAATPCNLIRDCTDEMGRLGIRRYVEQDIANYHCQFYYTCAFGRFLGHHMCAAGTVYDEANQQCTWPQRVAQPCGDLLPGQNPDDVVLPGGNRFPPPAGGFGNQAPQFPGGFGGF